MKCTAKAPGDAEYWLVHLAARPQINFRSAGRKRFAHLSAQQDEIHVDAPVPWGEDTLFTLEFRPSENSDNTIVHGKSGGHYALHTCNNKYLARDGKLLDICTRECLYAAEFHAGLLALRYTKLNLSHFLLFCGSLLVGMKFIKLFKLKFCRI